MNIGVGVIIENKGKFLIVQERYSDPKTNKEVDSYGTPMGHLDEGEDMIQCAIREVKEETGYSIKITSIIGLYDIRKAIGLAFKGELINENLNEYDTNEIKEVSWKSLEELKLLKTRPAVIEAIQDYLDGKTYPLSLITRI